MPKSDASIRFFYSKSFLDLARWTSSVAKALLSNFFLTATTYFNLTLSFNNVTYINSIMACFNKLLGATSYRRLEGSIGGHESWR